MISIVQGPAGPNKGPVQIHGDQAEEQRRKQVLGGLAPNSEQVKGRDRSSLQLTFLLLRSVGDGRGGLRVLLVLPFFFRQVTVSVVVAQARTILVAFPTD